jgi:hypothetical protein
MWKMRVAGMAVGVLLAVGTVAPAAASQGGDSNAGDVWTDNVGQPAGPGHEQDPHLACQDINLWGSGLADSSGTFTIDGWQPSGSQEQDYSGTWSYDSSQGGDQVVAVINVSQLISEAQANGDAPKNSQGYHFKLQLAQDPQKSKTFWVNCPAGSSSTTAQTTGSSSSTTGSTAASPTATSTAPTSAVKGTKVKRHRRRHLRRHHRKLAHRALRARRSAGFTG